MLELSNIVKDYNAFDNHVHALKGINLSFRKNEFVSILGPSGCGKTTLLNIIGGLDRYTDGDLSINGISTKKYKDKDWDAYRNHKIGFVFQSYNLIPHQSVLSNVELALTLSGVSKSERRKRATKVLNDVGLGDQLHKKPSQMSGGQMQRVAIARALVNDPDILLADEPTGALDSETSIQIMEILKKISSSKLIIMVTHNPDLAAKYSSRIIKLLDGKIIDDSNPYKVENEKDLSSKETTDEKSIKAQKKLEKKKSMNFLTALSLSFNNLLTKKTRTLLTSFAGSIGIIGIALILSLSSGMQKYIKNVEQDTLSSYPLSIQKTSVDYSGLFKMNGKSDIDIVKQPNHIYSNNMMSSMIETMMKSISVNDLSSFKTFLESDENNIKDLANDIKYGYDIDINIYKSDTLNGIWKINPNNVFNSLGFDKGNSGNMSFGGNHNIWSEMMDNEKVIKSQYDIVAGHLPTNYNEVVFVIDKNNMVDDYSLYSLGLIDITDLKQLFSQMMIGKNPDESLLDTSEKEYSYDDILSLSFKLVLNSDLYQKENGIWVDKSNDSEYMKNLIEKATDIKVVGILKPNENATNHSISTTIAYTKELTNYLIEQNNKSNIVKDQNENTENNIFTGLPFTDTSYDNNISKLGSSNLDNPSTIDIYAKDFKSKEKIADLIDEYNDSMTAAGKEDSVIHYTDYVGLMMSSVSDIINGISYVLIAFVAISLVVSSIMIGIITYISVLERTKEIGILRSIGASKRDISRVFNAETVIVGFVAGAIGIGISLLLNIPINIIIKKITGISNVSSLPVLGAVILIAISIFLTFIAGLIPSRLAAKKDPVVALRSE